LGTFGGSGVKLKHLAAEYADHLCQVLLAGNERASIELSAERCSEALRGRGNFPLYGR
jgi:hypothetical protein